MKKSIFVLLTIFVISVFSGCSSDVEDKLSADYMSPHEAAVAYRNGEDIVGKTVFVKATVDAYEGFIFKEPNLEINTNVSVWLMTLNETTGEYEEALYAEEITDERINDIKENEIVKITIHSVVDHYSISLNGILE